MIAAADLTNLLYVVGAIVAATLVSGFVLLRHRRPKSLEAGIEMFSRELKALQPEGGGSGAPVAGNRVVPSNGGGNRPLRPATGAATARGASPRRGNRKPVGQRTLLPAGSGPAVRPEDISPISDEAGGRNEARAPSPNRENEPG